MVVATVGTTTLGTIDPVEPLAALAAREGMWLHVDAAWGGAVVLVPECRGWVRGIQLADSITFDAHKWLSVPMGAGVFLTRHRGLLNRTFDVAAPYMPRSSEANPYARSMQWSRRFIGLKVFATLATIGWSGYADMIRSQIRLGEYLRQRLRSSGWILVNQTRLPVVCFTSEDAASNDIHALADAVVRNGTAWISSATTARGNVVLRACVTNHRSSADDVDALTRELARVRREISTKAPA
jgi:glutamate/tyrosine decarboxylase-like PLP-dependent enzyme